MVTRTYLIYILDLPCDLFRLIFDNLVFDHDDEYSARSTAQVKCSLLPTQILVQ